MLNPDCGSRMCAGDQFNLGLAHYNGESGLAKNEAEGLRLWTLSAAQGHASAQFSLAILVET